MKRGWQDIRRENESSSVSDEERDHLGGFLLFIPSLRLSVSTGIVFHRHCCCCCIVALIRMMHLVMQPTERFFAPLALVDNLFQHIHAALEFLGKLLDVFAPDDAAARAGKTIGPGVDGLALDAFDAEHDGRRARLGLVAIVAVLLERELRRRDGKVGREAGRPGDGPFAVGRGGRREVDDEGAVRRVGRRGGEHGGGVVVAEEVVDARVDGGVCGVVGQEGEDGLEGRQAGRGCVIIVVVMMMLLVWSCCLAAW